MGEQKTSKRRPRAELKQLMLKAGVEVYTGLDSSMGGERVNYANVFRHLEDTTGVRVTYGSVHERIWDNQRDFQLDVIRTAVTELMDQTVIDMDTQGAQLLADADLDSLAGRRAATQKLIRFIAERNFDLIMSSPIHRLQRSIEHRYSMLGEENPEREDVRDAILDGYSKSSIRFIQTYDGLLTSVKAQPRVELFGSDRAEGLRALFTAGRMAIDGAILHHSVDTTPIMMNTGPNGESEEWSAAAFAAFATFRSLIELEGPEPLLERLL